MKISIVKSTIHITSVVTDGSSVKIGREGLFSEFLRQKLFVSRKHCTIYNYANNIYFEDCSSNGSYFDGDLHGIPPNTPVLVHPGNKICLGGTVCGDSYTATIKIINEDEIELIL